MSGMSYTAPRFTEEDEIDELGSLTEDERTELRKEVMGEVCAVEENEDLVSRAQQRVREELELISAEEKSSLLKAVSRCPKLVDSETESLRFLRSTTPPFDAPQAAKNIAKYWAKREQIFGDRAFLALTSTGRGALSPEAIAILSSGRWTRLMDDTKSRCVIYYEPPSTDNSPIRPSVAAEVAMYVLSCAVDESESSQKNGIVVMMNGLNNGRAFRERTQIKKIFDLLSDSCMPWRIKAIHVCIPGTGAALPLVLPVVKHMAGRYLRLRMRVHRGCDSQILTSLEKHCLEEKHVPRSLHGMWNVGGKHRQWLLYRQKLELTREEGAW